MEWEVGDRVRVKKELADGFMQPWRGRFEKGLVGTIIQKPSQNVRGYLVEWDHRKVKYPNEWKIVLRADELESDQ
ncbi:MAG: hypothetical protein EP341_09615 [Sphingomonadales bacterium]|nr:MAG: hypothetical protein EP341_09615 [Sphingomonadales bacterium]